MAIERFSSRREALGDVLTKRLAGASRYLRIAGYFRSSLLEVVGEALEGVGEISHRGHRILAGEIVKDVCGYVDERVLVA